METLEKELEKLFCYTFDQSAITAADVDAVCTVQITNKIFEMVDAVAGRRQRQALDYYYDLLALKEPPMRILFLLARQFGILLLVKDLTERRYPNREIASKAGIPPFSVGKYQSQAKAFTAKRLKEILEAAVEAEEAVKTGKMGDILSVELFIIEYSR